MCGFVVIVNKRNNKINNLIKRKILYSQNHRGPDYSNFLEKDNLIFFHNRLSILDLSKKANQPMVCKKTGNIIVYNGEIYNFKEIKKTHFPNYRFKTNSDTEVLLELYKKYGKKMNVFLNGIFSFVIFDYYKKKLFLVRDRFGVKPLNYFEDDDFLICSTEVSPINIIKKRDINLNKIREYLDYGLIHHDNYTFFKGIKKVHPASYYFYDLIKKKFSTYEKYWSLKKKKVLQQKNQKEFRENYYVIFQSALKRNMVSDVPIALLLSSGADSTYIYRNLEEMNYKNLKGFSYGWKNSIYDESLKTRNFLNLNDKNHETVFISEKCFFDDLNSAVKFNEGPIGGMGTFAMYLLMKQIKKRKFKVTISGEGSDELNLGYFNQQLAHYYYEKKINSKNLQNFCKSNNIPSDKKFLKTNFLLDAIYAPDGTILGKKRTKKKITSSDQITKKYIDSFKLPKLLHWQDRCSGAFGIETRVPFLDHELVTFAYSNPNSFKIRGNISKVHLKDPGVRNEAKKYVATPQREILKKQYKTVLDIINNGHLVNNRLINFNKFKKEYHSYVLEKNLGNSFFVWKILNLELFLRNT